MTRILALLRNGKGLRHLPIVYSDLADAGVRVVLRGLPGGPLDVTARHFPVSLRPFVVGVSVAPAEIDGSVHERRLWLEISGERSHQRSTRLARIALKPVGALPLAVGTLQLFKTVGCKNWCVPAPTRWLRYALAWQHARGAARRGDGLRMSAADLRALNAYYIIARPVYLVGVADQARVNLFPMDLVGPSASGEFLLALRATSPSIPIMEMSRRIAMNGAPAALLHAIYALGDQHHASSLDVNALPFAVAHSPLFGLPMLADGLVRELSIQQTHRVGSHVLFVCRVERESGQTERQLAHVSQMYAEHLTNEHHPLRALR